MTATEAARSFSDLLDAVEHRAETFVITRNGEVVAQLGPALVGNGAALKRLLRELPPDPDWAGELVELRASFPVEVPSWLD